MTSEQQAGQPDTAPPRSSARRPAQARADASEPSRSTRVLAVDGTGLLVRCSRAATSRMLRTSSGIPTGALLMFANSAFLKIRETQPRQVVIAWDGPHARHWRQQIDPGYKAGRAGNEFGPEERLAIEFCAAAGFTQRMVPGFEADDILAALTRAALKARQELVLCSEDQDLLQLLKDTRVTLTRFTGDGLVTAADVMDEWRCEPQYLPMVRALAGDKSDGIPGVKGIGRRKAVRLLESQVFMWPPTALTLPDLEDRAHAELAHRVMDLTYPPESPEYVPGVGTKHFTDAVSGTWDLPYSGDLSALREVFGKYELRILGKRLEEGRLW